MMIWTQVAHEKVLPRLWSLPPRGERGAAVLATAAGMMVLATIVTVGAVVVASGEQKSAGNSLRGQQADSSADNGVQRGLIYLNNNLSQVRATATNGWMNASSTKWVGCTSSTLPPPCGDGYNNLFDNRWTAYSSVSNLLVSDETLPNSFTTHFLAEAATAGGNAPKSGIYHVVSEGLSGDGRGRTVSRQSLMFQPVLAHRPDAPLIAAGTIGLSGTISVVANSNGGGKGVPLSAWAGDNVSQSGSMQTCHVWEYLSTDSPDGTQTDPDGNEVVMCPDCECPNDTEYNITVKGGEGIDILDVDGNVGANPDSPYFPDDVFQYTFGVPEADWQSIRSQAQLITDCSTLSSSSSGLYWVDGNCSIPSGTVVGSLAAPVILVIANGNFQMNANGQFFGVLFAFAHDSGTIDVKLNGGPTLYGSMISNRNIDTGTGNYTARYDKAVLDNLVSGANAATRMALVPGSWQDY